MQGDYIIVPLALLLRILSRCVLNGGGAALATVDPDVLIKRSTFSKFFFNMTHVVFLVDILC